MERPTKIHIFTFERDVVTLLPEKELNKILYNIFTFVTGNYGIYLIYSGNPG